MNKDSRLYLALVLLSLPLTYPLVPLVIFAAGNLARPKYVYLLLPTVG